MMATPPSWTTDVSCWPPGTLMVYDNRDLVKGLSPRHQHHGMGLVVANDGVSRIRVVWDVKGKERFQEYDLTHGLNPNVIKRV